MLTKKDLELIRGVVKEVVKDEVYVTSKQLFEQYRPIFRQDTYEVVGQVMDDIILPKFDEIDVRLDQHELRFTKIESGMVTKDYLDDKFADFKAELSDTGGKAEQHVKRLAVTLQKNGVITTTQFRQVFET